MYDVVIIGAGPAGISSSLYCKRANKKTLVIYQDFASVKEASKIDNYYGVAIGTTGAELYNAGIKQATELGVEFVKEEVTKIAFTNNIFSISTPQNIINCKSIILAIGNKKKSLNIEGIQKFEGKGISYCAICDGFFYKNKDVVVIGSGSYAISEINDLLNIANKITLLTNGNKKPDIRDDNVEIISKPIKAVLGNDKVEQIQFDDETTIRTDGVFIAQGVAGISDLSKKLGILTNKDYIIVDKNMQTNIPGIYACGDCTGGLFQISKAVYEGTVAGLSVIKYLNRS